MTLRGTSKQKIYTETRPQPQIYLNIGLLPLPQKLTLTHSTDPTDPNRTDTESSRLTLI